MGLAETFALLREHNSLAEVLKTLEAKNQEPSGQRLPLNVVSLCEEQHRRRLARRSDNERP